MSNIDFRLGNLTGRLAGMVGASWKGINYIRKMVIPANPNTAGQQGTRTVFSWLVGKGRRINSSILKDFIIPTPKKMSAFNQFISRNQAMIDAGAVTIADMVVGTGGLYLPPTFVIDVDAGAAIINVSFDSTLQGEAALTDKVPVFCWNETQDVFYFETTKTRNDNDFDIVATGKASGDVIHVWMFATQGTTLSSETDYKTAVVT